jgi:hypothetical protein
MSSEIQPRDTPADAVEELSRFCLKSGVASTVLAGVTLFLWHAAWIESIDTSCLITQWHGWAQIGAGVVFMIWLPVLLLTMSMAALVLIRWLIVRPLIWRALGPALTGQAAATAGLLVLLFMPSVLKQQPNVHARIRCFANLRQIDGAKQQWALENRKLGADIPAASDITPYLKNGILRECPIGGSYTLNAVSADPTCTKAAFGHTL